MKFEEQLQRSFDAIADRFRDDILRHLQDAIHELVTAAEEERAAAAAQAVDVAHRAAEERLAQEVAAVEGRVREAGRLVGYAAGSAEGLEKGRVEGREAALTELHESDLRAWERLSDAVRAIDQASTLSEVLDVLVSAAGREAARAALLLVQGERLRGWRFVGFEPAVDDSQSVLVDVEHSGIIAEAIRTGGPRSADNGEEQQVPPFAALPPGDGSRDRHELLAVPLSMGGDIIGVLYADQAGVEQAHSQRSAAWPSIVEIMARHSARALEGITAFRAAQVLTERPRLPMSADAAVSATANDRVDGEDDRAARRYARLLISEIKLYHEAAVIAGRRERDLASRLSSEIAKARELYHERVPRHVRGSAELFNAELVRTLANGDASLFGMNV